MSGATRPVRAMPDTSDARAAPHPPLWRPCAHKGLRRGLPALRTAACRRDSDDPGIRADLANAVFASALQRSDDPSTSQIRQAVVAAISAFGGPGCAGRAAQEFGDHPETAVVRMCWARVAARAAFEDSHAEALL